MAASKRAFVLKVWFLTFTSISLCIIVSSLAWNVVREVVVFSSKQQISAILNFAVTQSSEYVELVKSGKITRAAAESKVVQLLTDMRYQSSYVWVNDEHAIARVHIRKELVGTFQQSYMRHRMLLNDARVTFETDSNLKPVIDRNTLKINGLILLPEWNWIIGYGLYYDDMKTEIWRYSKPLMISIVASFSLLWLLSLILLIKRNTAVKYMEN